MLGLMMDRPLLISSVMEYAERFHGQVDVVARDPQGKIHRQGYAQTAARTRRVANALRRLGCRPGDRIGTMAWNGHEHLELFYGIAGIGAVCHTINPRLHPDSILHILNHAQDVVLFADRSFLDLLRPLLPRVPALRALILIGDAGDANDLPSSLASISYESLLAAESDEFEWPNFDERTAAGLCYTSGTTGRPKGVLYTHRSCLLEALTLTTPSAACLGPTDVMAVAVPMFHVAAWGTPYAAPMAGVKYVLPGPKMDGASLYELLDTEGATVAFGVPALWQGLLDYMDQRGLRAPRRLRRIQSGGAPPPGPLLDRLEQEFGIDVVNGWGMTETNSVCGMGTMTAGVQQLETAQKRRIKRKAGRGLWGVELKHVGADGQRLPLDGNSAGELMVRGPWVTSGYYNDDESTAAAFDAEGWFRTGDVVNIDEFGYVQIVDRIKDMIKSGGEWISSLELEKALLEHDAVAEAAAIGIHHPRWTERPILVTLLKADRHCEEAELLAHMATRVPKWSMPDRIVFHPAAFPKTATGKTDKVALRRLYAVPPSPD